MTSDTYIYVLADQLCEWLVDTSKDKITYATFVKGLTDLGKHIMDKCILKIEENDIGYYTKYGRAYSNLSYNELEKLTHEVADMF